MINIPAEVVSAAEIAAASRGDPAANNAICFALASMVSPKLRELHPWKCCICGKNAKELLNNLASYTHVHPPFVFDSVLPYCKRGAACEAEARVRAGQLAAASGVCPDRHMHGAAAVDEVETAVLSKFCAVPGCLIKDNLQMCAGCRKVHYCSVEHQKANWPTHKRECKAMAKRSHAADAAK